MESLEYIETIKKSYFLEDEDLLDILEYLRYMARDNNDYDADSFLKGLSDEIERGV